MKSWTRARRIDLAHEPDFGLGAITVEPSLRKVTGPEGEIMLEPKVVQVLVALASPAGTILSRDDLIERCWDGRIVGDTSINRVISLLRSGFKNVAGDAVVVENVPKVGYRLIVARGLDEPDQPEPLAEAEDTVSEPPPQPASPAASGSKRGLIAAGALALVAAITAILWWMPGSKGPLPEISVAMLPLEVGEGIDPIYAKGLESELRTQFARVGAMQVSTSESAAMLVAQGISPEEIGTRLGVDYVWTGELSTDVERFTIKAKIFKSGEAAPVWQEDLVSSIDSAQYLPLRTARAGAIALDRPVSANMPNTSVSSSDYALYLTAMGLIKDRGREGRAAAADILEQVMARNPDFADGLAGLAKVNYMYPASSRAELEERRKIAVQQAMRALELDPNSVDALKVAGSLGKEGPQESLAMLRRATELDPGDAEAWFWYSNTQSAVSPNAGDELEPLVRMVAVDPLWPASWRASDKAMALGQFDLARKLEREIIAASATRQQRVLAEARLALINGDPSEFLRLVDEVEGQLNEAQQRWGYSQNRMTRYVLGLPYADRPFNEQDRLIQMMHNRKVPTRADLDAIGLAGPQFFDAPRVAQDLIPLMLRDGRGDELLAYYDARFPEIAAFEEFGEMSGMPQAVIPGASPYMVLALREAGREAEAREHLALTRKWVKVWRDADAAPGLYPELYYLALAAIEGDTVEATRIVRRLPGYGWPLQLGHVGANSVGLLFDDPLYDELRGLPEVKAVLDPIRAKIAKERREAMAGG